MLVFTSRIVGIAGAMITAMLLLTCVLQICPAYANDDLAPGQIASPSSASPAGEGEAPKQSEPNQAEPEQTEPEQAVMLRLYNPYSSEHFYTADAKERDSLASAGWEFEGESWIAPVSGEPVFRLYNPDGNGDHHYTMNVDERDKLVAAGWVDEGKAWYSTSTDGLGIYRLYNPYAKSGTHHYTSSISERISLVADGWLPEGVAWYGLTPETETTPSSETNPDALAYDVVYRLFCPATRCHLYTTSKDERNSLGSLAWHYEGAAWQSPSEGDPVYRLRNPHSGEYLFTTSPDECGFLLRAGWRFEGEGFKSSAAADESRIPVYRLYSASWGIHHYTASEEERQDLTDAGWTDEGVAFYGRALPDEFQDDLELWKPHVSGDARFDTQLDAILYYCGDLRSAYEYVASFPYVRGSEHEGSERYLDDDTTKEHAQEMIANHGGNCYRYASLFSWLARALGYDSRVISGWVPTLSDPNAPHGWVEIDMGDAFYIFDPDMFHVYPDVDWFMRSYDNPPTNYGSW